MTAVAMDIVAETLGFNEGPVICQDGSLVVTSIELGKVFRIVEGVAEILADVGGGANGATEGPDGRIFVAQNGGLGPARNDRRSPPGVQVIEPDGQVRHFGAQMTAPNDLCFGPDGFLYVTDPSRVPERNDGRIWRCDIETFACELILTCDWYPNGIGFSTDPDWIYVADSRHARIVRLPTGTGRTDPIETVVTLDHGAPDGFAFDTEGNLVIACPGFGPEGGDIQVYRDGVLTDVIDPGLSTYYTNLAISGDARLFLCDSDAGTVLSMPWRAPGMALHPFRSLPAPSAHRIGTGERKG